MAFPSLLFFISSLVVSLPPVAFSLTYIGQGEESHIQAVTHTVLPSAQAGRVGQERLQRKVILQVETELMRKERVNVEDKGECVIHK